MTKPTWQADLTALIALLRAKGIRNEQVLAAMAKVPRHLFVDQNQRDQAYLDTPLSIGQEQTISQPFIVARMTELLLQTVSLKKVLELGTGSGYQAAILAQLVPEVYSIERIETLHLRAKHCLEDLHINNVHLLHGDGYQGWADHAPYDGIIVTAAAPTVPQALIDQMADPGQLIMPTGEKFSQKLQIITKKENNYTYFNSDPVIFVPLLLGKI